MSNTLENLSGEGDQNPNNFSNIYTSQQEWDTTAQCWLSAFPDGKTPTMIEFEAWFDANHSAVPQDIKSMPRLDIYQALLTIQNNSELPHQEKEGNQVDLPHARFQRTDQWIPVYSWLEKLDKDEVVKSKEIADWLDSNPTISEELCSRHSRYHLMHYIKKCHGKILKRRERKKGIQQPSKPAQAKVQQNVMTKQLVPVPVPSNPLQNLPKDDEVYAAKRNEALQKFEILVELEKILSTRFPQPQHINN